MIGIQLTLLHRVVSSFHFLHLITIKKRTKIKNTFIKTKAIFLTSGYGSKTISKHIYTPRVNHKPTCG